ncbi:MAG: class II fructose-bisphosphate aldolase [Firmicutes bacterium]|nr:class II fructose-bisphosphate aldolase [Bacillota bacterium]MDY3091396.1 class II fructose-bisphosphate aldolase [Erysipelotrichaceae bacterium]
MLVNSKEVLLEAKKGGYAVPAPDFIDLDSARAYCKTAEKLKKPVILSFAQAHSEVISLHEAALIGKFMAEEVSVPVVLHLDHGTDIAFIKEAIELGFTSVMIDASMMDFDTNVKMTKEVVEYAHARNVTVEAEIGHVGSGENYENHDNSDSIYTTKEEAKRFVELTDVDSLAVSIGTAHGIYKGGKPALSFDTLHEIRDEVSVPLVLHGGSGTGDDNLKRCAKEGISKINVFTDFLVSAMNQIDIDKPKDYLALKVSSNKGMMNTLEHYYGVFETK